MTVTTAILVNVFIPATAIIGAILYRFGVRVAAHLCMVAVVAGYSLIVFQSAQVMGYSPYLAHENGTKVHTIKCQAVAKAIADGEDLRPYPNLQAAKDAGLEPHYCITNRDSTYTMAAIESPQMTPYPNTNHERSILTPPKDKSSRRAWSISKNR